MKLPRKRQPGAGLTGFRKRFPLIGNGFRKVVGSYDTHHKGNSRK